MKNRSVLHKSKCFLFLAVMLAHLACCGQDITIKGKTISATEFYRIIEFNREASSIIFESCAFTYTESDDDYRFAMDDFKSAETASGFKDIIAKPPANYHLEDSGL